MWVIPTTLAALVLMDMASCVDTQLNVAMAFVWSKVLVAQKLVAMVWPIVVGSAFRLTMKALVALALLVLASFVAHMRSVVMDFARGLVQIVQHMLNLSAVSLVASKHHSKNTRQIAPTA